jgi:hypothetical protein
MDHAAVQEYVERCRQLLEASPGMNEENTKVRLVQPFLELLGWDLYSTEVELEYTVPMASGSTHVDYALLVGESPVVFVEAKPVRSTLTDENVRQLRSYMRQELDVDWGILTNGKSFEVLTKNYEANGGEEVSVVEFELDDLEENPDVLELLSKESIRSGQADEVAEQVARTNAAIRHLRDNEDEVATAVADAVHGEVSDLPLDLEEQAREFVQDLVSLLHEQRQFVGEEPFSAVDDSLGSNDGSTLLETDGSTTEDIELVDAEDGYVVEFSDGRRIPEDTEKGVKEQKMCMGRAVDYLISTHGLLSEIEIPYSSPQAKKRCLINSQPEHPGGEQMRGYYTLTDGSYLFTSFNVAEKKRWVRTLADEVGISAEFSGGWESK